MQGALDSGNASIPEDANVHDVAGLLKQYFRELPEPLITSRLFPVFEACYSLSSPPDRQRAVLLACLLLPRTHLQVRLHNPIRSLTVSLSTYYQLLSNYVDTPDFLVIEFNYRQTEWPGTRTGHEYAAASISYGNADLVLTALGDLILFFSVKSFNSYN